MAGPPRRAPAPMSYRRWTRRRGLVGGLLVARWPWSRRSWTPLGSGRRSGPPSPPPGRGGHRAVRAAGPVSAGRLVCRVRPARRRRRRPRPRSPGTAPSRPLARRLLTALRRELWPPVYGPSLLVRPAREELLAAKVTWFSQPHTRERRAIKMGRSVPAGSVLRLVPAVDDMAPSFARGHAERRCSGACPQQARPPRPSPSRGPVHGWCP
jgi:hypothetical protein